MEVQNSKVQEASEGVPQEAGGIVGISVFFLVTFVILAGLVFWPYTRQLIPALADPAKIQQLGPVIETRYIGGFGVRTEVRTAGITLLLRRAVEIEAGTVVERRSRVLEEELCISGSDRCYEIVSRGE